MVRTYEKSGSACDSRVILLRGVQAVLTILPRRLCFSSVFTFNLFGWLERGTHLFAREAHSMSRSGRLPIHTPDRHRSAHHRAYQPREITRTLELETFHPFTHTQLPWPNGTDLSGRTSLYPPKKIKWPLMMGKEFPKPFLSFPTCSLRSRTPSIMR